MRNGGLEPTPHGVVGNGIDFLRQLARFVSFICLSPVLVSSPSASLSRSPTALRTPPSK